MSPGFANQPTETKVYEYVSKQTCQLEPTALRTQKSSGRESVRAGIGIEMKKSVCYNFNYCFFITVFKYHSCVITIRFSVIVD